MESKKGVQKAWERGLGTEGLTNTCLRQCVTLPFHLHPWPSTRSPRFYLWGQQTGQSCSVFVSVFFSLNCSFIESQP